MGCAGLRPAPLGPIPSYASPCTSPLELHLCAARNELRTLHKSEQFAAMAWCAGTGYKMRDSYLAWAERFRTHLRDPLEDLDTFVARLAVLL